MATSGPWVCGMAGFFGRKPSASAPAAAMPAGIVTLLGASLCYLPPHHSSG
jgi:hypothetical protein